MKKRALSLFLAVVMTLGLAAPAFGAEEFLPAEESIAAPIAPAPEDPASMEEEPADAVTDAPDLASVAPEEPTDEPMPVSDVTYPGSVPTFERAWDMTGTGTLTLNGDAAVTAPLTLPGGRPPLSGSPDTVTVTSPSGNSLHNSNGATVFQVAGYDLILAGSVRIYAEAWTKGAVIPVTSNSLTIRDNASVEHADPAQDAIRVEGGTVNVEGGTVSKMTVNSGTVTISGGTVTNLTVNSGTVTISNCKIGTLSMSGIEVEITNCEIGTLDMSGVKAKIANCKVGTMTATGAGAMTISGESTSIDALDITGLEGTVTAAAGTHYGSITGSTDSKLIVADNDHYFSENGDYRDPASGSLQNVTVVEKRGILTSDYVAPSGYPLNLTYNNASQPLVSKEGWTYDNVGQVLYALGTREGPTEEFTSKIPRGTDAGTYYVWWKITSGKVYKEKAPAYIATTINMVQWAKPNGTEGYSIDYVNETITHTDERYKIKINGTDLPQGNIVKITESLDGEGAAISVCRIGDNNHTESEWAEWTLTRGGYRGSDLTAFIDLVVDSTGIWLGGTNSNLQYAITRGTPTEKDWRTGNGGTLTFSYDRNEGYTAYVRNLASQENKIFRTNPSEGLSVVSGRAAITGGNEGGLNVGDIVRVDPIRGSNDDYHYYWHRGSEPYNNNDVISYDEDETSYTIRNEDVGNYIWYTIKSWSKTFVGILRSEAVPVTRAGYKIQAEDLTFTGEAQQLIQETRENVKSVRYTISAEGVEGSRTVTELSQVTGADAGKYTVTYEAAPVDGYKFAGAAESVSGAIEVTIDPAKTETALALTSPSAVTYGDNNVTLTAAVTAPGVTYTGQHGKVTLMHNGAEVISGTPTFTQADANAVGTATFTLTPAQLKNALEASGEGLKATFTAKFAGDQNLAESQFDELTFDAAKKTIETSDLTFTFEGTRTYDGTAGLTGFTVSVRNEALGIAGDTLTVTAPGPATLKGADGSEGKDVGTYERVTVPTLALDGADAKYYKLVETDNVQLTADNGVSVEVTKAPVTFEVNAEGWKKDCKNDNTAVTVTQEEICAFQTETVKVPAVDITVSYKYDGQDCGAPTMPGVYEVYASVESGNFELKADGGAAAGPVYVGTLEVLHTHKWSTAEWKSDDDGHWRPCEGMGECGADVKAEAGSQYHEHSYDENSWVTDSGGLHAYRQCNVCGYIDRSHYTEKTDEWLDGGDGRHYQVCDDCHLPFNYEVHDWVSDGNGTYSCSKCTASYSQTPGAYPVTGKVTSNAEDDQRLVGATVTLTPVGSSEGRTTITDDFGQYSFENVTPGDYTVTVTTTKDKTVTVTKLVTVTSGGGTGETEVALPANGVSSQVVNKAGSADAVAVGGLDKVAAGVSAEPGKTVTVTLTVEPADSGDSAAIEEIRKVAGVSGDTLTYLDVTLEMIVRDDMTGAETSGAVDTKGSVITLVVPYDFSGKADVLVYRYHDGKADALTKLNAKGGGNKTYYPDRDNGFIYIYANEFSVYAIGYTEPYYPSYPSTDKTALNAAITAAEALKEEDYTPESWSALETALAAAKGTADNLWATQTMVDSVQKALDDAVSALAPVKADAPADKRELEGSIGVAEELTEEDYTPETWAAVEDALAKARDVYADEDATQEDVDAALKALDDAIDALEEVPEPADKTDLEASIDAAGALDPEDYTEESWAGVEDALGAAKDVAADENATQEDVDAAQKALDDAVNALEKAEEPETVDKSLLAESIAEAEALNEEDYTAETWAAMAEALEKAKDVYADPDATQEEVDDADLALFAAILCLEEARPEIEPPAGGNGWRWVESEQTYYYFKDGKLVGDYWIGFADGGSAWANNWYYADADGRLLTGFQYLDDLKGGKAWYMLQTDNTNGTMGRMLTGWRWTCDPAAGTGWFSPKYGSQGACTYTTEWGSYNAATGLWADGLPHKG